MKTAEEYLLEYLTPLLNRIEESYNTIEQMKKTPEWDATLKAIEESQKDAYNQALDDAIKNASSYMSIDGNKYCRIDSESILKLKK